MCKIAKGNIERKIRNKQKELHKDRIMLSGRQAARMLYDSYATNRSKMELFNLNHFWELSLENDKKMEAFLIDWDNVFSSHISPPRKDQLEHIFYEKVKRSAAITFEPAVRAHAG